jgi:membrane protein YdbS with pleckstrin-like domain
MKRSKKKKRIYLKQKRVKAVTYIIIISCIILIIAVSLLKVWNVINPGIFWKLIITLLVIAAGSGIFTIVNGLFRLGK